RERRGNQQRLNRNAAVERRLQPLVDDALVRRMHVDENESGAVLREDVNAVELRDRKTERVRVVAGHSDWRCDPLAEEPAIERGGLVRVECHCLLAVSRGAGRITRAAAVAVQARVPTT